MTAALILIAAAALELWLICEWCHVEITTSPMTHVFLDGKYTCERARLRRIDPLSEPETIGRKDEVTA